jgi:hypothetical protein
MQKKVELPRADSDFRRLVVEENQMRCMKGTLPAKIELLISRASGPENDFG